MNTAYDVTVQDVFSTGTGADPSSFRVRFDGTGRVQFRTGSVTVNSTNTYNDGNWRFVTLSCDGANNDLRIYVDGVLDNTVTAQNYNLTDTSALAIGRRAGGSGTIWRGGIDGVRWYDRALSISEITDLYAYRCDFNPSQITTLSWMDAQDQTTITEASGSVSQWDDKSGNARNHTQGNAADQPTTRLNPINGLNALTFDGNDTINNTAYAYSGEYLRFSVVKLDATITQFKRPWSLTENGNGYAHNLINLGSGSQSFIRARYAGVVTTTTPSSGVDTSFNPFISYSGLKSGELSFWSTVDNTKYTAVPNPPTLQIDNSYLGSDVSTQNFFGEMGEVIDVPVSEEPNIDKIVGYLAWKWGLVSELPMSHPYKNKTPKS